MAHTYPVSPLVTIRFEYRMDGHVEQRHWYHVPRIGDSVYLDCADGVTRASVVDYVAWREPGPGGVDVEVRLV